MSLLPPVPLTTNKLTQSIQLVSNALNLASKAGVFDLDQAYFVKQAISNISKLDIPDNSNINNKNNMIIDSNNSNNNIDINELKASMTLIMTSLNDATKKGVYTMDDAFIIKYAFMNIDREINK